MTKTVLITGGAGFVGSNLCVALAGRHPDWHVVALDNLHRRGSELNLERLDAAGVEFVRGDVRSPKDLDQSPQPDVIVECSAEPSVMSGVDGDTSYLYETNLTGAYNCLELARRSDSSFVFLSSSRIYPLAGLRALELTETGTRFELLDSQPSAGVSAKGVSELMPLAGARTLYGTTKLAAELLVEEYRESFGMRTVVNRCGVIAGPWQMGKVDQGVFTHWMLSHVLGLPLSYIGYGGTGKQVRDLLHIDDLVDLVELQAIDPDDWDGRTFNVGGGREVSLSLLETTELCARISGNRLEVGAAPETRAGDVPVYISDCSAVHAHSPWRPSRDAARILTDIHDWILSDRDRVAEALAGAPGGRDSMRADERESRT